MTIYTDEILQECVEAVSELLTPTLQAIDENITGVHFFQGHPLEVIQELTKLSLAGIDFKKARYPMVALFRDYPEDKGSEVGIYSEVTWNIIIAKRTEPTYNTAKRKDLSFKPILHPIWDALEAEMMNRAEFNTSGVGLDYQQIDHYFWGREGLFGSEKNIFLDWIDCIEIKNLNLKIKNINC